MVLTVDRTVVLGADYQALARRLALCSVDLPRLREGSGLRASVPGDVRGQRQSAGGKAQLGTLATSEVRVLGVLIACFSPNCEPCARLGSCYSGNVLPRHETPS